MGIGKNDAHWEEARLCALGLHLPLLGVVKWLREDEDGTAARLKSGL